jgi:hypothetical protein
VETYQVGTRMGFRGIEKIDQVQVVPQEILIFSNCSPSKTQMHCLQHGATFYRTENVDWHFPDDSHFYVLQPED